MRGLAALLCLLPLVWLAHRARLVAPEPTLLLTDRHGEHLGELAGRGSEEVGYWPLGEIPPRVAAATLGVEDRRFWLHPGVDGASVLRAAWQNLRHGERVSGASTLAMQLARMQRPGTRGYLRKLGESAIALALTARYGREAVLRHYLTIVPYGNRVRGIAYAARRYLDKPVEDLSWAETAFLAAIPQSPAKRNPFTALGRLSAIERGTAILRRLAADGVISAAEMALAEEEIRGLAVPLRGVRPEETLHTVLRFAALREDGAAGPALAARPRVATTLDLELQRRAAAATARTVAEWEGRGAGNAAVLVVELAGCQVRAAVASTGYFDSEHAGAIDYLGVPRSSGSTLKPFLYGLALERGRINAAALLDDLDSASVGGIVNADDRYLGPMLPRFALANSRNVPAVALLSELGVAEGYDLLGRLGLHDGRDPAKRYGLGLAVGALPVTLEQLARAYTALANGGRLCELRWFEGQPVAAARQVFSEDTARLVRLFLADPQARLPSFPRLGASEYPFAVAVKTGTSSLYRDAWTVAYSSRYLVGVWVGHPDRRPMSEATGFGLAAGLAQEVLSSLHRGEADGLADLAFPPPRGFVGQRLCALSGRLATPACDRVTREWLPPGHEVVEECPVHRALAVDRRNGLLATTATPRGEVELRSFVELAPRYAAWAAASGLPRPPRAVSPAGGAFALAVLPGFVSSPGMEPRLTITSPRPDLTLLRDPETPARLNTLALRVVVDPPVPQVVWYVDGRPFATVEEPYTVRWPLTPGEHTFQVRLPFVDVRSGVVRVRVE